MTEELKKEILNILDNVYYWETCPQEYNDRIDAVKKQLTLTKTKKMKNELIEFLDWLSEEGICRWYSIEKEYGGEGESDIVERYLKEKDEEVGKSGKVQ